MKDNFLMNKSHREVFDALSNEDAGKLIKGVYKYVDGGDSELSGLMTAVFIPIKKFIDDNEKKYQLICERNRKNGSRGGRPKEIEETQYNPSEPTGVDSNPVEPDIYHISYINNHNSNNKDDESKKQEEKDFKEQIEKEFTELWKIYPNKKGKSQAMQKYLLVRKQEATYKEVRQGLESYIKYCETMKYDTQFIKHGSTWFNQKCWTDDYTISETEIQKKNPIWLDKDIKKEEMSSEELKELETMFKDI